MNKPREFWITDLHPEYVRKAYAVEISLPGTVHVIEYAAFQELEEKFRYASEILMNIEVKARSNNTSAALLAIELWARSAREKTGVAE